MTWFVIFKSIHVLFAIVMAGTTFTNGLIKMHADKTNCIDKIAYASELVIYFNWIFMLPSLVGLLVSGIFLAPMLGFQLTSGWGLESVVINMVLILAFLAGLPIELRLRKLARISRDGSIPLPQQYRNWSTVGLAIGFSATFIILFAIYSMISKITLF